MIWEPFAAQAYGAPGPQHKSGVGVFIPQLQPLLAPVMQRPQEAGQVAASVGELMDDAVRLRVVLRLVGD